MSISKCFIKKLKIKVKYTILNYFNYYKELQSYKPHKSRIIQFKNITQIF